MSYGFAVAPCFVCREMFSFDPERVPSIPIDPVTGKPPDLGGDPERAFARPLCPTCVPILNAERRKRGLRTWNERDTTEGVGL